MKYILIPANEDTPVTVHDAPRLDLDQLQALVGGWLEGIDFPKFDPLRGYINEEGKIDLLPYNRRATALWHEAHGITSATATDVLVGPVVLIGGIDIDGEDLPVTDEQVHQVMRRISPGFTLEFV